MEVTASMFERYYAEQKDIDFINKNYPDGVEAIEFMQDPNTPIDMLHFTAKYFPYSEEELKCYREICKIKDSKNCYFSEEISNCNFVVESKQISNSEYISQSENVEYSKEVYSSKEIKNSTDVKDSLSVKNSSVILYSKEIEYCKNVIFSDIISWSTNVFSSLIIDECSYVYQSSNLIDCHFCGFLMNCSHCLFCSGINDSDYYIFNKPVNPIIFEQIKERLDFYLSNENPDFIKIDNSKKLDDNRYSFKKRFNSIFDGLGADLYGFIGTIDNFDEDIFFQLFLSSDNVRNLNIKNLNFS